MAHPSILKSALKFGRERRESTRTDVRGVGCDRGRVVDISARGMRLISARRWREGQRRSVSLSNGDTRLTIEARCIWCRQDSMFSHAIGLAFDDPSAEQAVLLEQLAQESAAPEPMPEPATSE